MPEPVDPTETEPSPSSAPASGPASGSASAPRIPPAANGSPAPATNRSPEAAAERPLTIVANRLPVHLDDDGRWQLSPGGLVTAMTPVLRRFGGTWLGWSGRPDSEGGPIEVDGLHLHDVPLSASEVERYYVDTANGILWPLFHDAVRSPEYDADAWEIYRTVNRRFAEQAAAVTPEGGTVWIHDYHLLLMPGFLRALRPEVAIGLFLHIPVPPGELFATLPWRDEIVDSLMSASLVGTQTAIDAANLRAAIARPGPSERRDAERLRDVAIEAFPISIESRRFRDAALEAESSGRVAGLRERFGEDRTILLGVDRLDYTKGIDRRLEAFESALASGRIDPDRVCFIQVCVPSRDSATHYPEINARVDRLAGRINGRFSTLGRPVLEYTRRPVGMEDLIPLYRLADVMVVTPFRDGMNLVAKEYVACRAFGKGELILSEFAGAAHELREATIVNPHDIDAVTDALVAAWERHQAGETAPGMAAMHRHVMDHDVDRWARSFVDRLATNTAGGEPGAAAAAYAEAP